MMITIRAKIDCFASYEIKHIFFILVNWLVCIDKCPVQFHWLNKNSKICNWTHEVNRSKSYMDARNAADQRLNEKKKITLLFSLSNLGCHCKRMFFFWAFITQTRTVRLHVNAYLTLNWPKKKTNNFKHSANYYNYFMFNLCMSLFLPKQCLFAVAACNFRICNVYVRSNFAGTRGWDWMKLLRFNIRMANHKNEATIYLMIILNDNATFLFCKKTCFDAFNSHFCHVSSWLFMFNCW